MVGAERLYEPCLSGGCAARQALSSGRHEGGPDGVVYPMGGVYREIVEPERLVFTTTSFEDEQGNPGLENLNTITFAEHNGKTRNSRCM